MRRARGTLLASDMIRGLGSPTGQRHESLINGIRMLVDAVDAAVLGGHDIRVEAIREAEAEIRRHRPAPETVQGVVTAITTYIFDLNGSDDAGASGTRRILAGCAARILSEFAQIQASEASRRTVEVDARATGDPAAGSPGHRIARVVDEDPAADSRRPSRDRRDRHAVAAGREPAAREVVDPGLEVERPGEELQATGIRPRVEPPADARV